MNLSLKNILVPFDGSSQSIAAVNSAILFAKAYDSKITVVYIQESTPVDQIRSQLDTLFTGSSYAFMHKQAKPFKGIIEAVKEVHADLVCMGTHGREGFEEFWMGTNSSKVVTSAGCPVLTMREGTQHEGFKSIVLPLDTSFESRQKVPFTIHIAKKFGAVIHIVAVSVDNDKESEHQINVYARQAIHAINEAMVDYTYEKKLGGNITKSTIDYAKSINADLIVIMTEQESQIGSFFLGKFATQMVNHSPIPVISISPREDLMVTDARI
jgi:nucleotide-binding universal stress UspA family protein